MVVCLAQNFTNKAPDEGHTLVIHRGKRWDGDGNVLVATLPGVNFLLQESVALLLHVEVDDPAELFLPDLETINVDVVGNVLERPLEAIELLSKLLQLGLEIGHLSGAEQQNHVQSARNLVDQLLADTILEQLLRVDLDDSNERGLHGEDALCEHRHHVRGLGQSVPLVQLSVVFQQCLLETGGAVLERAGLHLDDGIEDNEHVLRNDLEHSAHVGDKLATVVLGHTHQVGALRLVDADKGQVENGGQLEESGSQ
mmetsp:Transcript_33856/g.77374  ORF Transcript_33856/g.77374 Transcript_33856/m.77374 type:complete len:255 (+) Transcript_33856:1034-1798(+)